MKTCSFCGAQYPDNAVVCANDQTQLPDPASPTGTSPEEKHSGLGIASFIMSLAVGCLMLVMIILAAVLSRQRIPGDGAYPGQMFVGLMVIFLLAVDVIAFGLGIAGLCQRRKKRLFGVLGLVFSGAVLVGTVGLIAIGLAYVGRHAQ